VFYCGLGCQKADWSRHRKECSWDLTKKVEKKQKEHGKDDERVAGASVILGGIVPLGLLCFNHMKWRRMGSQYCCLTF
jgi:hypothetical protein